MGVSKAWMSVSEIVDSGHHVLFDKNLWRRCEQRAAHKESGIPLEFVRRYGAYEVDWDIPFQGEGARDKTARFPDMLLGDAVRGRRQRGG